MKFKSFLLGAILALASLSAFSTDYVYATKNVSVTARGSKACYPEVLALLTPEALKLEWRAADIVAEGQTIKGCWAVYEGAVAIVTENGDGGLLNQSSFHQLKDV